MTAESDASRLEDRLGRMEAAMSDLKNDQADLKSGQRWLTWGAGIVCAVLVAVVAVNLDRNSALGDRVAEVQVTIGQLTTTMDFVREDVSEIKTDVKAVAAAVGANLPDEKKAELVPR